eukprot:scaffold3306_cov95-Cylindrotheca_fusiformis.AAC.2
MNQSLDFYRSSYWVDPTHLPSYSSHITPPSGYVSNPKSSHKWNDSADHAQIHVARLICAYDTHEDFWQLDVRQPGCRLILNIVSHRAKGS